jgi:hypothetical protein
MLLAALMGLKMVIISVAILISHFDARDRSKRQPER